MQPHDPAFTKGAASGPLAEMHAPLRIDGGGISLQA